MINTKKLSFPEIINLKTIAGQKIDKKPKLPKLFQSVCVIFENSAIMHLLNWISLLSI